MRTGVRPHRQGRLFQIMLCVTLRTTPCVMLRMLLRVMVPLARDFVFRGGGRLSLSRVVMAPHVHVRVYAPSSLAFSAGALYAWRF